MADAPQVSVVLPAHNVAPYIRPAVDSVLSQTLASLELIVVDDGSTDGTTERLAGIDDPRIRILHQSHQGLAAARNAGLGACRAAFVGFIDGDDLWAPGKLARHVSFLATHPNTDLSFSHSVTIAASGRPIAGMSRRGAGTISFRDLLAENLVRNCSSVVLRRDAVAQAGAFDTNLRVCADYDMWLRIALLRPGNIYCIPEGLTFYRQRPGQLSKDRRLVYAEWLEVLEKMRGLAPEQVRCQQGRAKSNLYRYLAYRAYEEQSYREAATWVLRGFRCSPAAFFGDSRNWIAAAACASALVLPAALHERLHRWVSGLTVHRAGTAFFLLLCTLSR